MAKPIENKCITDHSLNVLWHSHTGFVGPFRNAFQFSMFTLYTVCFHCFRFEISTFSLSLSSFFVLNCAHTVCTCRCVSNTLWYEYICLFTVIWRIPHYGRKFGQMSFVSILSMKRFIVYVEHELELPHLGKYDDTRDIVVFAYGTWNQCELDRSTLSRQRTAHIILA